MTDTDAIRRDFDKPRPHHSVWLTKRLVEALDHIDAQAEENKRLKETASKCGLAYSHGYGCSIALKPEEAKT